ncbi:hypothetical protein V6N13_095302 [Hibiscus sabdariffa]|uniref:Uncharacterized protein n=1 Tax=Hibiscus sabdariffa TaxID=183260 RepID=A0ABR2PS47_9ROSI
MRGENNPPSPIPPPSLKYKLKSSLRLLWLCRHRPDHHQRISLSASTTPLSTPSTTIPTAKNNNKSWLCVTSTSTWLKSPDFKDKCRNLINRIGHGPGGHRRSHSHCVGRQSQSGRRRHSADFRYDPSSYALNFDEGCDGSQLDNFPLRNFSARLPPSPITNSSAEITT